MLTTNIFDLEPNKVPTSPEEYSTFIYGPPKIGKTTLAFDMFGSKGLFLATEDRHKALPGAMVIRITSWVDYLTVMGQLSQPKAKELYDAVIIDTAENLYSMLEKYVAAKWKEKSIGERQDIWGKDWTDLKNMWKDGLQMIPNNGFVPVFIAHATQNTVQIPASGVLKSDLDVITAELKTVKDKNTQQEFEVYEFQKFQPDLKDKVMGPINKMVDNILFINTTIDVSTNGEQRVIYLRDTLQWQAGSTFDNIEPIIPLSAKAYRKAVQDAIGHVDKKQTTDKTTRSNTKKEYNYQETMDSVKSYGMSFHKAGKLDFLNAISEEIFGLGNKMTEATEGQIELLVQAKNRIEQKAKELKIEL